MFVFDRPQSVSSYLIYSRTLIFIGNGMKIEQTPFDYLCRDQRKSESDFSLISNCCVYSEDVTLV